MAAPLGVQLLLLLMPAPLDMLCVLGSVLSKRLPSTDVFWNETASSGILVPPPVNLFCQANDFVKGTHGLWHPRNELDHPGLHSVWSQVTDFPEVELRLLQKRNWLVVISQKWKFEDDIILREARALFRGLQMIVCAEHVRNARVLCLTDSMSCALAFERGSSCRFEAHRAYLDNICEADSTSDRGMTRALVRSMSCLFFLLRIFLESVVLLSLCCSFVAFLLSSCGFFAAALRAFRDYFPYEKHR